MTPLATPPFYTRGGGTAVVYALQFVSKLQSQQIQRGHNLSQFQESQLFADLPTFPGPPSFPVFTNAQVLPLCTVHMTTVPKG